MTAAAWYLLFSTPRKVVILFYNLVVLTSLITTAVPDLQGDIGILQVDEELYPMHTAPAIPKAKHPWRKRMLYSAGAIAGGTSRYQTEGRRGRTGVPPQPSVGTEYNEYYSSSGSSNTVDYNIISEACAGDHGLEVQQDNNTHLRGLPVYHVSVINTCLDCSIQNIHIACGDWASATEVDPLVFKRIANNDCVVNDGKPIVSQGAVYFEYSNSFPYPMNVQSAFPSCS